MSAPPSSSEGGFLTFCPCFSVGSPMGDIPPQTPLLCMLPKGYSCAALVCSLQCHRSCQQTCSTVGPKVVLGTHFSVSFPQSWSHWSASSCSGMWSTRDSQGGGLLHWAASLGLITLWLNSNIFHAQQIYYLGEEIIIWGLLLKYKF